LLKAANLAHAPPSTVANDPVIKILSVVKLILRTLFPPAKLGSKAVRE
jgi:hypothetical protein